MWNRSKYKGFELDIFLVCFGNRKKDVTSRGSEEGREGNGTEEFLGEIPERVLGVPCHGSHK